MATKNATRKNNAIVPMGGRRKKTKNKTGRCVFDAFLMRLSFDTFFWFL